MEEILSLFGTGILETGDIEAADLHQPLVILLHGNAEFARNLLFARRSFELLFRSRDGGFNLFRLAALLPWRPIQTAKAVENRTTDLVFSVSLQLDVVSRVEVINRRDQPKHTGRHQIIQ